MSQYRGPGTPADGRCLVVSMPLQIKRRGGRKQVIAPEGQTPNTLARSRTNAPLALTLARAHRWRDLLEEGRYGSIRALALALGVDNSYVARLLRLTLLAPDVIEAILDGTEPSGLSLGMLFRVPLDWEGQRQALSPHSHEWSGQLRPPCRPVKGSIALEDAVGTPPPSVRDQPASVIRHLG